jgi:hypothetical protein
MDAPSHPAPRSGATGARSPARTYAPRTLSALGVPTRFTYNTFDHLMNCEELHATYAFQGRKDLILRPDRLIERLAGWRRAWPRKPRHEAIDDLGDAQIRQLVSMECLIGVAYTRAAETAGLTGAHDPSMGRVNDRLADWRSGVLSYRAQLWVDRNFALDYTLKSLEKLADGARRRDPGHARSSHAPRPGTLSRAPPPCHKNTTPSTLSVPGSSSTPPSRPRGQRRPPRCDRQTG